MSSYSRSLSDVQLATICDLISANAGQMLGLTDLKESEIIEVSFSYSLF